MRVGVFSTKRYDRDSLSEANTAHELVFLETRLTSETAAVGAGHQAFFTDHALREIARTTLANVTQFERGEPLPNRVA
jgi:lactate dehydrogenase-like 2-hydroxyacid dehydrogenase